MSSDEVSPCELYKQLYKQHFISKFGYPRDDPLALPLWLHANWAIIWKVTNGDSPGLPCPHAGEVLTRRDGSVHSARKFSAQEARYLVPHLTRKHAWSEAAARAHAANAVASYESPWACHWSAPNETHMCTFRGSTGRGFVKHVEIHMTKDMEVQNGGRRCKACYSVVGLEFGSSHAHYCKQFVAFPELKLSW